MSVCRSVPLFHHLLFTAEEKLPSNCQAIGTSFKCLREALDEPLEHASMPINMHSSPFLCISSLIGHSCGDISFRLSDKQDFLPLPSGSTLRGIVACFHGSMPMYMHLFCILSLLAHCRGEISYKLSDNQDFLQVPSGST